MEHIYQDLPGWFDSATLYKLMVDLMPNDSPSKFVEVGSWLGRSSAYLAVEIVNSKKPITLECVDIWEDEDCELYEDQHPDKVTPIYQQFIESMRPVESCYTARKMTSLEAAVTHQNGSLDFVFIDASHEYEDVKSDIIAWYPKLKPGGVLGGDDLTWETVANAVYEIFPATMIYNVRPNAPYWMIIPQVGGLKGFVSDNMCMSTAVDMIRFYNNRGDKEIVDILSQRLLTSLRTDFNVSKNVYKGT